MLIVGVLVHKVGYSFALLDLYGTSFVENDLNKYGVTSPLSMTT